MKKVKVTWGILDHRSNLSLGFWTSFLRSFNISNLKNLLVREIIHHKPGNIDLFGSFFLEPEGSYKLPNLNLIISSWSSTVDSLTSSSTLKRLWWLVTPVTYSSSFKNLTCVQSVGVSGTSKACLELIKLRVVHDPSFSSANFNKSTRSSLSKYFIIFSVLSSSVALLILCLKICLLYILSSTAHADISL